MPLYMVRHGSTKLNAGDPSDPKAYFRGWTDIPLSEMGQETAYDTGKWFKDKQVGTVVSSDLPRAQQTAHAIGKATGAPVVTDPRLRPWNVGHLTGQRITPELLKLSEDLQKNRPNDPAPGGESYNDFIKRYAPALKELLQHASTNTVVAVAHHRNALALQSLLYGKKTQTDGPPQPGGVVKVTPNGLKNAYTPPRQRTIGSKKATS